MTKLDPPSTGHLEKKKNVSQFSINIHILNIDGKFLKIKIILPNWLWKVGKVLSYFLRKSDIFFQKSVKNGKNGKKIF